MQLTNLWAEILGCLFTWFIQL